MRKIPFLLLAFLAYVGIVSAQERHVRLKLVQTSDVHGNFYPYDFIRREAAQGSLARVSSFINKERKSYGDNLLLVENGDLLQGQPTAYYYNYIDTTSTHLAAEVLNYMGYNVGNLGNHDVETGLQVFNRWASQCRFPILGANVIDTATRQPVFQPYTVLEREGVKIAVLGMITPAIPVWLPENLWQGLCFDDMEQTARRWMKVIQEKEKPHVVVGLFHAGTEAETLGDRYRENASLEVARRVPGFDVLLLGHDHRAQRKVIINEAGKEVLVLDPGSNALQVGQVEIDLKMRGNVVIDKSIKGRLVSMKSYEPDADYLARFGKELEAVNSFVDRKIGFIDEPLSSRQAYFGSSAFIDLIHTLQLHISGAQISLTAPLSYDASIPRGDIRVSDMFNLYKYENLLYTMRLTGQEIKDLLESSYGLWAGQMKSPDNHLLLLEERAVGKEKKYCFVNFSFNFDSAAGICYTVDVTRPIGDRIHITSLADGTPFDLKASYEVALNSYRGNGGGSLLTEGAGIPQAELSKRLIRSTDKDLRYYLMKYIEEHPNLHPVALGQWRFVPEEWTQPAARRDYKLLFGE